MEATLRAGGSICLEEQDRLRLLLSMPIKNKHEGHISGKKIIQWVCRERLLCTRSSVTVVQDMHDGLQV